MKKLSLVSPCPQCPYKQGLIKTLVNPCPKCKRNGYEAYKQFIGNMQKGTKHED